MKPVEFNGRHWCPTCRKKWIAVWTHYSVPGNAWHCTGCMKTIERCSCG